MKRRTRPDAVISAVASAALERRSRARAIADRPSPLRNRAFALSSYRAAQTGIGGGEDSSPDQLEKLFPPRRIVWSRGVRDQAADPPAGKMRAAPNNSMHLPLPPPVGESQRCLCCRAGTVRGRQRASADEF